MLGYSDENKHFVAKSFKPIFARSHKPQFARLFSAQGIHRASKVATGAQGRPGKEGGIFCFLMGKKSHPGGKSKYPGGSFFTNDPEDRELMLAG